MQTSYAAGSSSFSKNLLRLAVPIVLQNLVTTAVSSADVIMLGFVSQDALAAGSPGKSDYVYSKPGLLWNLLRSYYAGGPVLGQTGYSYH